ncbi:hypothetical protein SAMD00019534_057220 [Acytostelium subglobosum LB1]|uniref:hypothetical protein n=1 Tax=Acytostelium subglobosum LB1 TaxID=1410327 RepID=UPI0006447C5C|nr:hypothetical protein SAMD00019534_057220 [Acytostelium subglobosum LB1]GAM22547.1 hypothetical protein SAMD00019534_057220 [Acytostelium subglobosum LB1]|eukprot:XP_012754667.1 hypothetical protein SAMD00019534_057220 [Acytostelium subglobosum LB1]
MDNEQTPTGTKTNVVESKALLIVGSDSFEHRLIFNFTEKYIAIKMLGATGQRSINFTSIIFYDIRLSDGTLTLGMKYSPKDEAVSNQSSMPLANLDMSCSNNSMSSIKPTIYKMVFSINEKSTMTLLEDSLKTSSVQVLKTEQRHLMMAETVNNETLTKYSLELNFDRLSKIGNICPLLVFMHRILVKPLPQDRHTKEEILLDELRVITIKPKSPNDFDTYKDYIDLLASYKLYPRLALYIFMMLDNAFGKSHIPTYLSITYCIFGTLQHKCTKGLAIKGLNADELDHATLCVFINRLLDDKPTDPMASVVLLQLGLPMADFQGTSELKTKYKDTIKRIIHYLKDDVLLQYPNSNHYINHISHFIDTLVNNNLVIECYDEVTTPLAIVIKAPNLASHYIDDPKGLKPGTIAFRAIYHTVLVRKKYQLTDRYGHRTHFQLLGVPRSIIDGLLDNAFIMKLLGDFRAEFYNQFNSEAITKYFSIILKGSTHKRIKELFAITPILTLPTKEIVDLMKLFVKERIDPIQVISTLTYIFNSPGLVQAQSDAIVKYGPSFLPLIALHCPDYVFTQQHLESISNATEVQVDNDQFGNNDQDGGEMFGEARIGTLP